MLNQLMLLNPSPTGTWMRRFARAFERTVGRAPTPRELQMAEAQRRAGASVKTSLLLTRPHIYERANPEGAPRPFQLANPEAASVGTRRVRFVHASGGHPHYVIDEVVTPQGHYITLPGIFTSRESALESLRRRNPDAAWHAGAAREYAAKVRADEAAGHAGAEEYWSGALAAESRALAESGAVPNPGADWHFHEASRALERSAELPYGSPKARYEVGQYDAHMKSERAARRMKMNPRGGFCRWFVVYRWPDGRMFQNCFTTKKEAVANVRDWLKNLGVQTSATARIQDLKSTRWWIWGQGRRGTVKLLRSHQKRAKNPCGAKANPSVDAGYMRFHGAFPTKSREVRVPDGFPKKLWLLGEHYRTVLKTGEVLSGGLVAAGGGNTIYLLKVGGSSMKKRAGRVAQIEYTPRKPSERHGATYYHTYKSPPRIIRAARGYYIIRGARQKLTSRGIIG